jgi:hypothetical protein
MILSPNEVAWVAREVGFADPALGNDRRTGWSNWTMAVAVALAESSADTDAMGISKDATSANYGNTDHGLWQISNRWNAARLKAGNWRDPLANGRMALALYRETLAARSKQDYIAKQPAGYIPSGWEAWSVYNSGTAWKNDTVTQKNLFISRAAFGVAEPWPPVAWPSGGSAAIYERVVYIRSRLA